MIIRYASDMELHRVTMQWVQGLRTSPWFGGEYARAYNKLMKVQL